jgi:hypothetical protein
MMFFPSLEIPSGETLPNFQSSSGVIISCAALFNVVMAIKIKAIFFMSCNLVKSKINKKKHKKRGLQFEDLFNIKISTSLFFYKTFRSCFSLVRNF